MSNGLRDGRVPSSWWVQPFIIIGLIIVPVSIAIGAIVVAVHFVTKFW